MKKIILLATIMAFTFAVRADGCGDQAKDKASCGTAKTSAQSEKSGCCAKTKVSTQAEKSGCCTTKVSTESDKSGCPMAKDKQAKSSCPFAKDKQTTASTTSTACQSPKAAAN